MTYTIRPNTAGGGWTDVQGRTDLPATIMEVRQTGRPKLVGTADALEIEAWIKSLKWAAYDAPVFLEGIS